MSGHDDDEVLYDDCQCFEVVRFIDEQGEAQVCISFHTNGVSINLSEEEFVHFAEVMGGIETPPSQSSRH
ncbi:MAG: hypothetical protein RL698_741 [Pseudomonadota bacterium]|jgi:hypothetical protein